MYLFQISFCYSGRTFSLDDEDIEDTYGVTIKWTVGPNLIIVGSDNSSTVSVRAINTSVSCLSWAKAQLLVGNIEYASNQETVWVGKPNVQISGLDDIAPYSSTTYTAFASLHCPVSSYLWDISSSTYALSYYSNTNQTYPIESKGALGSFYLYLTAGNYCGSSNFSKQITVSNDGGGGLPEVAEFPPIIIYPNPARDYINVKVSEKIISEIDENKILKYEIILYNSNQQIVYKKKSGDELIRISTKHMDNGFYYLHFVYKKQITKEKVIISK